MSSSIPGMWTDRLLSISRNLLRSTCSRGIQSSLFAEREREKDTEYRPLNGVPAVPVDPKSKVGYGQWLVPGACI